MAEFSSLVSIFFDPDSGEPSGLQALVEGDTIASSVLDPGSRDALTRVVDSSAGWEQGLDTDTYNNLVTTSGRAEEMVTFSANIQSSATYLSSVLDASVGSGIVDVCAYIAAEEGTWNSGGLPSAVGFENWNNTYNNVLGTSGDRDRVITYVTDGSANIYDVSTNFSTFSGNIEASTRGLSSILDASVGSGIVDVCAYIIAEEGSWSTGGTGPSATGFENWNNTYDNVSNASGDRDRVITYVTQGSGNIGNVSSYVGTSSGALNNVKSYVVNASANIESVSGSVLIGSGDWDNVYTNVNDTSGDRDRVIAYVTGASADIYDASTNFGTFSGDVEASFVSVAGSAVDISAYIDDNEATWAAAGEVSADGFENWDNTYDNVSNASGDRDRVINYVIGASGNIGNVSSYVDGSANITEVSAYVTGGSATLTEASTLLNTSDTALLTGATPTLSNDLDVNNNDIIDVKTLSGVEGGVLDISGTTMIFTSPEGGFRLGSVRTDTATWTKAGVEKSVSAYDYSLSAWTTVKDNSGTWGTGGGGGITPVDSPVRSGQILYTSGAGPDYALTHPGSNPIDGRPLVWNSTLEQWTSGKIAADNLLAPGGGAPPTGSMMVGNGTSYLSDATIGNTSGNWDTAYGDVNNNRSVSGTVLDNSANWNNTYAWTAGASADVVSVSSTVLNNSGTWATDTDTTDHTALSNIGTNTHAQIDEHITGVVAASGNWQSAYTTDLFPSATGFANWNTAYGDRDNNISVSTTVLNNSATWGTDTDTTDHTALSNIGTNTHPQIDGHIAGVVAASGNWQSAYTTDLFPSATGFANWNTAYGDRTNNISVSTTVLNNSATWGTDTDTTDHTLLSNIGTNTHAQIDAHITGVTTASGNWQSAYTTDLFPSATGFANWNTIYGDRNNIISVSSTVLNNSGTWGGGGGGASAAGFENWNSTYDSVLNTSANWNEAYLSATNTTDVSSIFSGNIDIIGTTPAHSGTIGTTNAATFGLETTGNCSIIAPSIILSATSAYQFRKNGSTTFTDTDFPQSCRDWDSTYGTVLNNSGTWGGGGGGGGGVAAGITIVNTGTDNINSTGGALVPLDTSTGFPAYGTYGTDYSYTAGNSYVTINTAGTYEVTFNVAYTTVTARWNGILKIYKGTGGASPSAWIGYGAGKMGYVRNSTGHNEASLIVTCLVTCSANDTIGGHVINEAANGTCTLVANESFMTIKRMS